MRPNIDRPRAAGQSSPFAVARPPSDRDAKKGFFKATPAILFNPDLTTTEAMLIMALGLHDWGDGDGGFPSNETLIKAARLKADCEIGEDGEEKGDKGHRALRRLLAGLKGRGYIDIKYVEPTRRNPTGRVIYLLPKAFADPAAPRAYRPGGEDIQARGDRAPMSSPPPGAGALRIDPSSSLDPGIDPGAETALASRRRPEETTEAMGPADADGGTAGAAAPVPARPSPVPAPAPAARATPPAAAPIAAALAAIAARVATPAAPSPAPAPIPPAAAPPPAPAPAPAPAAVAAAEPGPPAPPGDAVALGPGQVAFLAELTDDQRARFEGWPDSRRASTLAMFARGPDPVLLAGVLNALAPPRSAPEPPPGMTVSEMIAALTGPMGRSLLPKAPDALMVALDDQGGQTSYRAYKKLCDEVFRGTRPPESFTEPLEKTMAELARGKPIDNPAAYIRRGVTNWDRDHPRPDAG